MPQRDATERGGVDIPPSPLPPIESLLAFRALQIATAEIGVREDPPGSNSGPRVDQYLRGLDGKGDWLIKLPPRKKPWCARAAVYCFGLAAIELGLLDPFRGAANGGGLASAYKLVRFAKSAGLLVQSPQPGDLAVKLHDDDSGHVAMVAKLLDAEHFESREGNASDAFRCRRQRIDDFNHFIRLR